MIGDLKGNIVVGLDVGTTKVCIAVGREDAGKIRIMSAVTSPSSGLRKGIIIDRDLTVSAIRRALKDAEDKTALPIRSAYVSIAGSHIRGFYGYGVIGLGGRTVSEGDVERLMSSASASYLPAHMEVLHVIPAGFRLDGSNGVVNPIGMSGERLEASVHIITASATSIFDLVGCCEEAGVEVSGIVLEPIASAESVLREDEKDRGVALIDIGGGTTGIVVYRDGVLRRTAVVALGGNHLTNDIAVGLGVSAQDAEQIKKTCGCALMRLVDKDGEIEFRDCDTNDMSGNAIFGTERRSSPMRVPLNYLTEIIWLRCEELMGLAKEAVETCDPEIVVLTGGTSLLRGMKELAEDVFGLPVRVGLPEGLDRGVVDGPEYAAGVGLVHYGLRKGRAVYPLEGEDKIRVHRASNCGGKRKVPIETDNTSAGCPAVSPGILERMGERVSSFLNKSIKGGTLCLRSKM